MLHLRQSASTTMAGGRAWEGGWPKYLYILEEDRGFHLPVSSVCSESRRGLHLP
jgi:hypothetical protein